MAPMVTNAQIKLDLSQILVVRSILILMALSTMMTSVLKLLLGKKSMPMVVQMDRLLLMTSPMMEFLTMSQEALMEPLIMSMMEQIMMALMMVIMQIVVQVTLCNLAPKKVCWVCHGQWLASLPQ